jgi:acyl-CoA hydrolase
MEAKRPAECSLILSHVMLPEDANPAGNVHGGVIMKYNEKEKKCLADMDACD